MVCSLCHAARHSPLICMCYHIYNKDRKYTNLVYCLNRLLQSKPNEMEINVFSKMSDSISVETWLLSLTV